MNIYIKNLILALIAIVTLGMTSCSEDKLGDTIFPATEEDLDQTSYTYPLDAYLRDSFLIPYNVQFIYKMEDVGTKMQRNVVPANYEKSVQLAVLSNYLWYDVYRKLAGEHELFLKKYSPRIIHVIGSPSYNSDGTMTLGYAENGIKITLQAANWLDYHVIEGLRGLNYMFFHTMHHEFVHILDQTYSHPQPFNLISNGLYDSNWPDTPKELANSRGFVTPYASAEDMEDWAELISNYVTMNEATWDSMMVRASFDYDDIKIEVENEDKFKDSLTKIRITAVDLDSVGYYYTTSNYEVHWIRKMIRRDGNDRPQPDADGNIIYEYKDGINGVDIINQKLTMAKQWLKDHFQIDLDELRKEVQGRQYVTNPDGTYKKVGGNYVNRLSEVDPVTGKSLMDTLLEGVEKYKK